MQPLYHERTNLSILLYTKKSQLSQFLHFFLFLRTRYQLKKSSLSFHLGTFLRKSRLQPREMWQSDYRVNRQKNRKIAINLRFNTVTQRNRRNVRVFVTDFLHCEMQDTKRISFDTTTSLFVKTHSFVWCALYFANTYFCQAAYFSLCKLHSRRFPLKNTPRRKAESVNFWYASFY